MNTFKKAVLSMVGGRVMPQATIQTVETVSEKYRLIDIVSDGIKGAIWRPGSKIMINVGGWNMRTYTPLSIDPQSGFVRILAFIHGNGPGSSWAGSVKSGVVTNAVGPRPSLDFADVGKRTVFFGDETSFAAAATLQAHVGAGIRTPGVFEVSSVAHGQAVVDRLGLRDVSLVEKKPDGSHLSGMLSTLAAAMLGVTADHLILTGNAHSIQGVRAGLRAAGLPKVQQKVKAYWAPGKAGLD